MAAAAFALHHAVRFDKRRIIVAVPFTTITSQNAAAYREAFGDLSPALLEHHSNVVDDEVANKTWQRLSAPGWDAEFIVTTTVQLFEALFSNRKKCGLVKSPLLQPASPHAQTAPHRQLRHRSR